MNLAPHIDLQTMVQQSDDLVAADLDGEIIMLSLEMNSYYGLDDIGSRIWTLLAQPITVSEMCDILVQEYEVEHAQCVTDVLAFLHDLAADRLVYIVDAPAA